MYPKVNQKVSLLALKNNTEVMSFLREKEQLLADYAECAFCHCECPVEHSPAADVVQILKEAGYKVKISHLREYKPAQYWDNILQQKGGRTLVSILDGNGNAISGVAHCNNHDSYNKKLGVAIALRRALQVVIN